MFSGCEAFYFINTFVLSTTQTQHREADSYFEKCRKTQTEAKKNSAKCYLSALEHVEHGVFIGGSIYSHHIC